MRWFAAVIIASVGAALVTPAAAYDGINSRQAKQSHRIAVGERNGSLTRYEASRLRWEQSRIARYERYARADGRLSMYERARIAAAQDRASRHIYHEKHDGDRRHSYRRALRWW